MSTPDHAAPASRESLSPDRLVEEALALAEAAGLQAVTIRGVAKRLGVTPMALYWHFRNKDDLLDGMVSWLYGAMDITLDKTSPWQDQLRSLIDGEIAVLRAHPEAVTLLVTRGSTSTEALTVIEAALAVLHQAGFPTTEATQVMQHAELMIISLVAREPRAKPSDRGDEQQRRVQAELQSLPSTQFSHVIAAAAPLSTCVDPEGYYAFGIELLMAGIEAMAARRR